jgi:hypothetical protein
MMRTAPGGSLPPVGIFFGCGIGSPVFGMTAPLLPQQVSQQLFLWNRPLRRSRRLGLQQLSHVLQHFGAGQQAGLQHVVLQHGVGQQVGLQQVGLQHVVGQAGLQQVSRTRRPQQSRTGLQRGSRQQCSRQRGAGAQHCTGGQGLPQQPLWNRPCRRSHRRSRPQQVLQVLQQDEATTGAAPAAGASPASQAVVTNKNAAFTRIPPFRFDSGPGPWPSGGTTGTYPASLRLKLTVYSEPPPGTSQRQWLPYSVPLCRLPIHASFSSFSQSPRMSRVSKLPGVTKGGNNRAHGEVSEYRSHAPPVAELPVRRQRQTVVGLDEEAPGARLNVTADQASAAVEQAYANCASL